MASSSTKEEEPNDQELKWTLKKNPFEILGLDINSQFLTKRDIKKAYHEKISLSHFDKTKNTAKEELSKKYGAAYNFLKNADEEKLQQLIQQFTTGSGDTVLNAQDYAELANVLMDKSNSERYRRLFASKLIYATENKYEFRDNFKSFYSKVFEEIEEFPWARQDLYCKVCEEHFNYSCDHSQRLLEDYMTFWAEERKDICKDNNCEDVWTYTQKLLPGTLDLKVQQNAGEWDNNSQIRAHIEKWQFLFDLVHDLHLNHQQTKEKLRSVLRNNEVNTCTWTRLLKTNTLDTWCYSWVWWWSQQPVQDSRSKKEDNFLEMLTNLLQSLLKIQHKSEEDICAQVLPMIPFGTDPYKIEGIDFILPGFLIFSKKFKDWGSLAQKFAKKSPRLSVVLSKAGALHCQSEKDIQKVSENIGYEISNDPNGIQYANICFHLGNRVLIGIGRNLGLTGHGLVQKQLGATYLQSKNEFQLLKEIGEEYLSNVSNDRESAAIFIFRYAQSQISKGKIDDAVTAMERVLPFGKVWNCILLLFKDKEWDHLMNSKEIAKKAIKRVKMELENDFFLSSLFNLVDVERSWTKEKLQRISTLIRATSAALHVLGEGEDEELKNEIQDCFKICLKMNLYKEQDVGVMMALVNAPGIRVIIKKLLKENHLLNSKTPLVIQPGSNYHAWLLFLRGVYKYKCNQIKGMSEDFNEACLISSSEKIPNGIANFISHNPLVQELLLTGSSADMKNIREFLDKYTGNETIETSDYPWVFMKTAANLKSRLSLVFSLNSKSPDAKKYLNIKFLEKDILGRGRRNKVTVKNLPDDGDNSEESDDDEDDDKDEEVFERPHSDYAEQGYSYVDLIAIASSREEEMLCNIMAAHHFLKAMMSPSSSFPQKYAYRTMVLECMEELKGFINLALFPPIYCQLLLRIILSFTIKVDNCFSREITDNRRGVKTRSRFRLGHNFIEDDEEDLRQQILTKYFQTVIALRMLCPLLPSEIFTVAEGEIVFYSVLQMESAFILKMVKEGIFSPNIPEPLFHQYLFNGIWMNRIAIEKTGYEPPLPAKPAEVVDDDPEDVKKARKKEMESYEELIKKLNDIPLSEREGFRIARENCMKHLSHWFENKELEEVERIMSWNVLQRTPDGFLHPDRWSLNFDGMGQGYSRFVGVEFDAKTGDLKLILEKASFINGDPLFSDVDLYEMFGFQIVAAQLSFDEDNYCRRDDQKYAELPLMFNPFNKVTFTGVQSNKAGSKTSICGTHFLATLYHLDLLAKILTTGQEVSANFPFDQRNTNHLLENSGASLKSILAPIGTRKKVGKIRRLENIHRFWFHIEEVEQYVDSPSESSERAVFTVKYGDAQISLKTKNMTRGNDNELNDSENPLDESSPEAEFVREFNANLDTIMNRFPIIARTKELAKISACVGLLKGNEEVFEKLGSYDYRALMKASVSCQRPYSRCNWKGSVRDTDECKCTSWVPAVFNVATMTEKQKLEFQQLRKHQMGPENAITYTSNDSKEDESFLDRLLRFFASAADPNRKEKVPLENITEKTTNIVQRYRVYGGVAFFPTTKKCSWLNVPWGIRPGTVKTNFRCNQGPPSTHMTDMEWFRPLMMPKVARTQLFQYAKDEKAIFKTDPSKASNVRSDSYKGVTWIYYIKAVGEGAPKNLNKFGITSIYKEIKNGTELRFPRCERQIKELERDGKYKFEFVIVGMVKGKLVGNNYESKFILAERAVDQTQCILDESLKHDFYAPKNNQGDFLKPIHVEN